MLRRSKSLDMCISEFSQDFEQGQKRSKSFLTAERESESFIDEEEREEREPALQAGSSFLGRNYDLRMEDLEEGVAGCYFDLSRDRRDPDKSTDLFLDSSMSESDLVAHRRCHEMLVEEERRRQRNLEFYIHQAAEERPRASSQPSHRLPLSQMELFHTRQPSCLMEISRSPILCPQCRCVISPSNILQHFVSYHTEAGEVAFVELYLGNRHVTFLSPDRLEFQENTALVLFAYGGRQGEPEKSLISRKLALPNAMLQGRYKQYRYHTPILLMVCRTSWLSGLVGPISTNRIVDDDLWIFWLLAAQMLEPLNVTLTAYNRMMDESLSQRLRVRSTSQSQRCDEFLHEDCNYLMLRHDDVRSMTHNFTQQLRVELAMEDQIGDEDGWDEWQAEKDDKQSKQGKQSKKKDSIKCKRIK